MCWGEGGWGGGAQSRKLKPVLGGARCLASYSAAYEETRIFYFLREYVHFNFKVCVYGSHVGGVFDFGY